MKTGNSSAQPVAAGLSAKGQSKNDKTNFNAHGTVGIAQRSADSIRLQTIGQIGGA